MFVNRIILIATALIGSEVCALGTEVLGSGVESCGTWLQNRGAQSYDTVALAREFVQESWVLGYLTGSNNYAIQQSGSNTAGVDANGFFSWIDGYCQAHPLDNVFQASGALVRALDKRSH